MKFSLCRSLGCCLLTAVAAVSAPSARADDTPLRQKINFDADWRFQKDDPAGTGDALSYPRLKDALLAASAGFLNPVTAKLTAAGPEDHLGKGVAYAQPRYDSDDAWRHLNLPHDWGIEGPFKQEYPGETGKLPWWGVAWYRKHFNAPAASAGSRCYLDIDGAMAYAAVWCNGHFAGGWPYGYASWQVDLTPFLHAGGDNVLAIRLDNPPDSSRWYPGGGIYRHVWLETTPAVHVAHWGEYVTTPEVSDERASVTVATTVDNRSGAAADLAVQTQLFACTPDGEPAGDAVATAKPARLQVQAGASAIAYTQATVDHPKRWDLQHPSRYMAVTTLVQDQKPVDRVGARFGIRTTLFTANDGFLLNGQHVRLQGVCDHADLGALGSAINDRALERQVEILKSMGCNAIRTSHNPPAPELLELCDRLGMLVMDEAFDCWQEPKKPNGYNLLFDDWHDRDMRALVRRDRNHPSVILWSIGNEIPEQDSPQGPLMAAQLSGDVRQEDYSRPATYACSSTESGYDGYQKGVDVFGFNYRPGQYPKFRAANPTIPIFGSETASCISSRGFFVFPVSNDKSGGKADFQMSDYDLYAPGWATPPDDEFKGEDEAPFAAGEFVWTGFDYLGEPTPYSGDMTNLLNFPDGPEKEKMAQELKEFGKIPVPSRSSYFGIVDLAGFPKERYYLYQSRWRADLPMAHLLPHWTWPERVGQVTPVFVYTSGDEAELFLNGQSLGRKKKAPLEYRLRWDDIKYAPGELKVVAYKEGKPWAADVENTAGPAAKLALAADRDHLTADGRDLSYLSVTIVDAADRPAPRAANRVHFTVTGPAEIVATDAGDATNLEPFQSPERAAFNGRCLAIVRTRPGAPGAITVKAEAEGLEGATVQLESK
jgi:beta-galactosidase